MISRIAEWHRKDGTSLPLLHIGNIHIQCLQLTGNFQESHGRNFLRTIRWLQTDYRRLSQVIFIARWLSCAFRIQGSYLVETITIAAPAPVYAETFVLVSVDDEGMAASRSIGSRIENRTVGINLATQFRIPCLSLHIIY